jgi:hypothetical protein
MKINQVFPVLISCCMTAMTYLSIGSYELEEVLIYNYSTHRFSSMEFFMIKVAVIITIFCVTLTSVITIRYVYRLFVK